MPYKLIKGKFHIHYSDIPRQGPEPDGDTLKFEPDTPAFVDTIHRPGGIGPAFNGRGFINLRFEGIDALETHFAQSHQNEEFANAARDFVLDKAGFQTVDFFSDLPNKVEAAAPHPTEGYIFAKTLDGHGRIVAFVFAGPPPLVDGSDVFVTPDMIASSINAQILEAGLVYPTFYTTLPADLRNSLKQKTVAARAAGSGLWPSAVGAKGAAADIPDFQTLQTLVLWPKLFRRLVRFFAGGRVNLAEFPCWLREDPVDRDDAIMLPNSEIGNMHDLFKISGQTVEMKLLTEDIVILPDEMSIPVAPCSGVVDPGPDPEVKIVGALVNPIGRQEVGHERVTLMNIGATDTSIEGWRITDRQSPQGGDVLSGALASGDVLQHTLSGRVRLGNFGDTITLYDEDGDAVDQVSYDEAQGQVEGRTILF